MKRILTLTITAIIAVAIFTAVIFRIMIVKEEKLYICIGDYTDFHYTSFNDNNKTIAFTYKTIKTVFEEKVYIEGTGFHFSSSSNTAGLTDRFISGYESLSRMYFDRITKDIEVQYYNHSIKNKGFLETARYFKGRCTETTRG